MRPVAAIALSLMALMVAVGGLVHVRSLVLAERYRLGAALTRERQASATAVRLRERWERASDPAELRRRATRELGMRSPHSSQVIR